MGLAAAEEAADPDRLLLFAPQSIEECLENPVHPARVFAIADKVLELEAQRLDLSRVVADLGDLRDAVVQQLKGDGITKVKRAVRHGLMKLSAEVMGTAM